MVWILTILLAISNTGIGSFQELEFDSKEDCHEALDKIVYSVPMVAYCAPKQEVNDVVIRN